MLVLTRKETEEIVIDDRIKVAILAVSGKIVRLGIEAPEDVPIRRGELKPVKETAQEDLRGV